MCRETTPCLGYIWVTILKDKVQGILRNQCVQDVLLTFNTSPFTFQPQSRQKDISSLLDISRYPPNLSTRHQIPLTSSRHPFEETVSKGKDLVVFSAQKGMNLPYQLWHRIFACTQSIGNWQQLRSAQEAPRMCSPNNILAAFHAYRELSQISLVLANS